MRKASKILGIVGGVLAILGGLILVMVGVFFRTSFVDIMETTVGQEELDAMFTEEIGDDYYDMDMQTAMNLGGTVYIVWGAIIVFAGILGTVGGAIVNKTNVGAGILMLIGALIALVTIFGILSFFILLLGGIFALVKDNSQKDMPSYNEIMENQGGI